MPEWAPCTPSVGSNDFKGVNMADFLNAFEAFLNGDMSEGKEVPPVSEEELIEVSDSSSSLASPMKPVVPPIASSVSATTPVVLPISAVTPLTPVVPSILPIISSAPAPVVPPIVTPVVPSIVPELKAPPDKDPPPAAGNLVPSTESNAMLSPAVPVKPIVPPIKLRAPPQPPPPIPVMEIKPVKGKVYPPTYPPPDRPGRNTNQLLYIKRYVITAVWKHKFAWPFKKPVDAEKLKLPDYHKIITQPMDFGTIKKRLQNKYYWCADECKKDFEQVFFNCYLYNKPDQDIVFMGKTLEKIYQNKLQDMMATEKEMDAKTTYPRKKQLVAPPLKRSYTTETDQERNSAKKMKNYVDFESEIPIAQISAPNKQIKKSPVNGKYSDSESSSDSESEDSEEESQSTIQPERYSKPKPPGSVIVGLGRSGVTGAIATPLSERKPVKHYCKYCDQPFTSRYVRDMHEKRKHLMNSFPVEKKVPVQATKPVNKAKKETSESKVDLKSAASVKQAGPVKPAASDGLQIIPVCQSVDAVGAGLSSGAPAANRGSMSTGNNGQQYDHTNFVDKKHQALHKLAMRNKAKMPGGHPSNGGNGVSNGHLAERNKTIPEDMLFPLPEDYTLNQSPVNTFSNNSSGSEKSNIGFRAKQIPDSGYLSSRGMPIVDSSPEPSRAKMAGQQNTGQQKDKFPVVSEGFNAVDRFNKATDLRTLSGPVSSIPASTRTPSTSADMASMGELGLDELPLCLTSSSRITEDTRLTDLQEELSFVEPTFSNSLLCRNNDEQGAPDLKKYSGSKVPLDNSTSQEIKKFNAGFNKNTTFDYDYRSSPPVNMVKTSVASRPSPSPRTSVSTLPISSMSQVYSTTPVSAFSLDLSSSIPHSNGEPRPVFIETRHQPLPKEKTQVPQIRGGIPSAGLVNKMPTAPRVPPIALSTISSISTAGGSNGGSGSNITRRPRGLILATAGVAASNAGGGLAPGPRHGGPLQRVGAPPPVVRSIGLPSTGPPQSVQAKPMEPVIRTASVPAAAGSGGAGAKMDVLAETLKLSDLDFNDFEAEPAIIQQTETQELKLEDLKHLRHEPPLPIAATTAVRSENKVVSTAAEDLRDLIDFSNFSVYRDVRPITGPPSQNLSYPCTEAVYTAVTSPQSTYTQSSLSQAVSSGSPFQLTNISTVSKPAERDSFSGGSFPLYDEVMPGDAAFTSGMDFELQSYPDRKSEGHKSVGWP